MRRWLARSIGGPRTASFRRCERTIADARGREPWADARGIGVAWNGLRTETAARRDAHRHDAVWAPVSEVCLDEQGCDHVAHLAEIRDGIHLHALAGVNPRDEVHRSAMREFAGFFADAYARAAGILQGATTDQARAGIAALGLRRPSATWTYMISENPPGSPMDRAVRAAGRWMRTRVYRVE